VSNSVYINLFLYICSIKRETKPTKTNLTKKKKKMAKYTIHSTKEDWKNLYKELEILNDVYGTKIDIKKAKKSTSFDMWDLILHSVKRKVNLI
jgi:hypothetical protein